MMARLTLIALFLIGAAGAPALEAQTGPAASAWPNKPVRMTHGFIAGGAVDITARLVAAGMTDLLGQQVIVDGRPGRAAQWARPSSRGASPTATRCS